jgi:hypothetical protein
MAPRQIIAIDSASVGSLIDRRPQNYTIAVEIERFVETRSLAISALFFSPVRKAKTRDKSEGTNGTGNFR